MGGIYDTFASSCRLCIEATYRSLLPVETTWALGTFTPDNYLGSLYHDGGRVRTTHYDGPKVEGAPSDLRRYNIDYGLARSIYPKLRLGYKNRQYWLTLLGLCSCLLKGGCTSTMATPGVESITL